MEAEEKKEEGKSCCPCGKSKCCCKAFAAVGLLVIGLIGGYFVGRHCGMCAMKTTASASAPAAATPAK